MSFSRSARIAIAASDQARPLRVVRREPAGWRSVGASTREGRWVSAFISHFSDYGLDQTWPLIAIGQGQVQHRQVLVRADSTTTLAVSAYDASLTVAVDAHGAAENLLAIEGLSAEATYWVWIDTPAGLCPQSCCPQSCSPARPVLFFSASHQIRHIPSHTPATIEA